ncbi:MAG: hypothetical protein D3906_00575 [Candidatus Electrothrix sp. AUS1_2]|nr:hypothetical protein [Candidatus Electrothrix sp. AUS1_2]
MCGFTRNHQDQQKKEDVMSAQSVAYRQVRIKGVVTKIVQRKKKNGDDVLFKSHVTVPAPDTLSHPTTYALDAEYPVGTLDSEVDVICDVKVYWNKGFCNYSLWLAGVDAGKKDVAF